MRDSKYVLPRRTRSRSIDSQCVIASTYFLVAPVAAGSAAFIPEQTDGEERAVESSPVFLLR
jgi:hypothetical protein